VGRHCAGQGTQAALQFAKLPMQSRECAAHKSGVKVASKCASGTPQCSAEITKGQCRTLVLTFSRLSAAICRVAGTGGSANGSLHSRSASCPSLALTLVTPPDSGPSRTMPSASAAASTHVSNVQNKCWSLMLTEYTHPTQTAFRVLCEAQRASTWLLSKNVSQVH